MNMAGADCIRDLCLALAHRVEPERLFVILTSYFDESGTHGDSPVTIMAAVMGNVKQWSSFQSELEGLKKRYGFSIFHTKEFKARSGEFSSWHPDKCQSLVHDLYKLTSGLLMHATVASLSNAEYKQYYRKKDNHPKLQLDSRYGLCFRACLLYQMFEAVRRLSHHKRFNETKLNVVVESGHKNAGAVVNVFAEEQKRLRALGVNLLDAITFKEKVECDPLMVADFLAYSTYMREDKGLSPPQDDDSRFPGPREKAGLTHLAFSPESLTGIRSELTDKLKARLTYGASRPFVAARSS
jgi:hypothetical protein